MSKNNTVSVKCVIDAFNKHNNLQNNDPQAAKEQNKVAKRLKKKLKKKIKKKGQITPPDVAKAFIKVNKHIDKKRFSSRAHIKESAEKTVSEMAGLEC